MKIKIKKSVLSSKIYNAQIKRSFRKKIKRYKRDRKYMNASVRKTNPSAEQGRKIIEVPSEILFPSNINKIDDFTKELNIYFKTHKISISHKKLTNIDNISILILTAKIDMLTLDTKLFRNKKFIPKSKIINERLTEIGYWEALCCNAPVKQENLDFLRMTSSNSVEMNNSFQIGRAHV